MRKASEIYNLKQKQELQLRTTSILAETFTYLLFITQIVRYCFTTMDDI